MWVGSEFNGDDNKALMHIQHDVYSTSPIASKCIDIFIRSCEILSRFDELYEMMRKLVSYDHRTLQQAHDQIAAYFRFSFRELHLPLINHEEEYKRILLLRWQNFYDKESSEIAEVPCINQAVIQILAHQNKDVGMYAETVLSYHLNNRYGEAFREQCKRFRDFGLGALPKRGDWPYELQGPGTTTLATRS